MRKATFNAARGVNEIYAVVVVFFNPGADGENIRVENDVFRREAYVVHQNVISSATNFNFAIFGIGLAHFVKRHNHHSCTVFTHQFSVFDKGFFTFLQRDRVHNRFTLHRLQTCLNYFPFGRVDHHWHFCRIGFGRHNVEETGHTFFAVE